MKSTSFLLVVALSLFAHATDWYVAPPPLGNDNNNGTSSTTPFATILRTNNPGTAQPGDTVHVAEGAYACVTNMHTTVSGTATARLRYISDKKWGAQLCSSGTSQTDATWWNSGDYVDIQDFDISGSGYDGIYEDAPNGYNNIIGNHVHDITAGTCSQGGAGIIIGGGFPTSTGSQAIGNWVHNVGSPSVPCTLEHGIYCSSSNCTIQNNVVFNNQSIGIHLWHAATNAVISGNIVHSNSYGGILIGAETGYIDQKTQVYNNEVFSNGLLSGQSNANGIEEYGSVGANTYTNNLVYNNGPADWQLISNTHTDLVVTPMPQLCNSALVTYSGCH